MLPSSCRRPSSQTYPANSYSVRIRNPLFVSFIEFENFDSRYRRVYRARERHGSGRLRRIVWSLALIACSGWVLAESAFGFSVF